ncbi:MAG: hypothetical protein GEU28_08020 [Dehalococcoidia bacterium]|nr:hypothetical protein [Dehalococcoidia bacterium]
MRPYGLRRTGLVAVVRFAGFATGLDLLPAVSYARRGIGGSGAGIGGFGSGSGCGGRGMGLGFGVGSG